MSDPQSKDERADLARVCLKCGVNRSDALVPSKQRFSLEEIERESAQTPATGRMFLPVHVVRTFVNAANGETMPSIEDWALAARLTAAELSKAGAEIERLRAGLEEIAYVIGDNYERCWMRVKAREILRGAPESRDG